MQKIEFSLNREFVQLNQLLKLTGLCDSGGAGKALVAGGTVSVDGSIELRKTCKIRVGQVVRLGDVEITVVAAAGGATGLSGSAAAGSQIFGRVTPCCPWYFPPRSLYEVSHTSSDSKNTTCATPSLA